MKQNKIDWQRGASVLICLSLGLFGLWVALRYLLPVAAPFLLAALLVLFLSPASDRLARRTHLPRRLSALLLLLVALLALVLLCILLFDRLFREAEALLARLTEDPEAIALRLEALLGQLRGLPLFASLEKLSGSAGLGEELSALLATLFREGLSTLGARLSSFLTGIAASAPSALLFLLVFLLSAFYFALSGEALWKGLPSFLPPRGREFLTRLRGQVSSILYRYLRVYGILLCITFSELLVGFLLLGRRYALLLALLISAVDILPVLGAGCVLLPWAGISLLLGDYRTALGLLILWGVMTIVRQIVEPRLVGDSLGIHPLVALAAIYVGLKLFGVWGMLLAPGVAVLVRLFFEGFRGEGEQKGN